MPCWFQEDTSGSANPTPEVPLGPLASEDLPTGHLRAPSTEDAPLQSLPPDSVSRITGESVDGFSAVLPPGCPFRCTAVACSRLRHGRLVPRRWFPERRSPFLWSSLLLDTLGRLKALPSLTCPCTVGSRKILPGRLIQHRKYTQGRQRPRTFPRGTCGCRPLRTPLYYTLGVSEIGGPELKFAALHRAHVGVHDLPKTEAVAGTRREEGAPPKQHKIGAVE
ncbi:hypothetical protein NDU88_006864 [Pleurodeles waltl]|uniref:Uncharacterized protein n=1 Tax=Pleurodeles waltl TaxID=8319 RepID=A0AAV7LRN4_PLEWA|nr:hypothetical protein NDU88_006864 [Pleurodeles waltl]